MSPKRRERVAPPASGNQWEVRYATSEAVKGWEDLCQQAASGAFWAWEQMMNNPAPAVQTPRHAQLKGRLATHEFDGRVLPQWQLEVTSKARVWYLPDAERRTSWIVLASVKHPKATE